MLPEAEEGVDEAGACLEVEEEAVLEVVCVVAGVKVAARNQKPLRDRNAPKSFFAFFMRDELL